MEFMRICIYLVVYFVSVSSVHGKDECTLRSACVCVFPNGTGIDLRPAATQFYSAQEYDENLKNLADLKYMDLNTYYYHPCIDTIYNVTVTPPTKSTCNKPLALCRHASTMKLDDPLKQTYIRTNNTYDYLGKSENASFSNNGDSITYINGPSQTTVLLQCAETANQLRVFSTEEPNKIVLAFFSKDACLKQIEEVGRSFGSTLLIIFFSFVIFYLVLGICTKKFLMGATGVEVIPNLGFWTELPNLVKDGWLFMINGCKLPARASGQTVSPDPNSYDSI